MNSIMTRRGFLGSTLASAALAPVSFLRTAEARSIVTTMPLSDDLYLIIGAGGNAVVARSDKGLLLIDGGTADHARDLEQLLQHQFGRLPLVALFNTHWHTDHTGCNDHFVAATKATQLPIIAHENTRLWMTATINSKWENRRYQPRPMRAQPTQTFYDGVEHFLFGGDAIEFGYLPQAHTDGDLYVFLPRQNVVVAGDVVSGETYPVLDYCTGGWLGGMINGLKLLQKKCNADTRIVCGSGSLRTYVDLQSQIDMCTTVLGRIGASYYKGETREEFLASKPTAEFDAKWGNPELFIATAYDGAWGHINELRRPR
jgi:glyoxylase-like metal-dependent hydrolase (beta-lactamase superfamily II)